MYRVFIFFQLCTLYSGFVKEKKGSIPWILWGVPL